MSEFHDLVVQLVEVYERDVAAARKEPRQDVYEVSAVHLSDFKSMPTPHLLGPDGLKRASSDATEPEFYNEVEFLRHSQDGTSDICDSVKLSTTAAQVANRLNEMDDQQASLAMPRLSSLALGSVLGGNLRIGLEDKTTLERRVIAPLDSVIGIIISLNVILTIIQLQVRGVSIEAGIRTQTPVNVEEPDTLFFVLEHIFNAFFLAELVLRVLIMRGKFLVSNMPRKIQWFNLFDAGIVVFCSVDLYLTPLTTGQQSSMNLMFARILRLARLARTFKVIQMLRAFSKLRILLKTVASSVLSFTWSMVILAVFNLGGAIFICQMLQPVIADETLDMELRMWLLRYYGTSAKSVWTMFEFTFSGGWPTYARPVIEGVHWSYSIFFALYVSIVVFAVIRIITALFLKDTLNIAAKDAEFMVQESMKAKREYAQKLKELFMVADSSGNGSIDFEEFRAICSIPEVVHYFQILDLDVSEVQALFNLLDDGDGSITYDEFVRGIVKLKGTARSMDVLTVVRECTHINNRCQRLERMISGIESQKSDPPVSPSNVKRASPRAAPTAPSASPTSPRSNESDVIKSI